MRLGNRCDVSQLALGRKIPPPRQRPQIRQGHRDHQAIDKDQRPGQVKFVPTQRQDHRRHPLATQQDQPHRHQGRQARQGDQRAMGIDLPPPPPGGQDQQQHGQEEDGHHSRGTSTERIMARNRSSTSCPSTSASAVSITRCRKAGNAIWTTSSGTA